MQYITYNDFLDKYPYFRTLDPDFKKRIDITTMTIVGNIESDEFMNAEAFTPIPDINDLVQIKDMISDDFVHTIIFDGTTYSTKQQKKKYVKRCTKKTRKIKFEQITFKADIDEGISLSIKLFSSGLFHITGANKISSIFWIMYQLFLLFDEIGYCKLGFKNIRRFDIEMINCKCFFPCIIDKQVFYEELKEEIANGNASKVLSVNYDPMRHSAIKIKIKKANAINDADILTYLIFAFGKMLITGANNYNEITYAYKVFADYLVEHHKSILEFDEDIINRCLREDSKVNGKVVYDKDGNSSIMSYEEIERLRDEKREMKRIEKEKKIEEKIKRMKEREEKKKEEKITKQKLKEMKEKIDEIKRLREEIKKEKEIKEKEVGEENIQ